ncbi:response regulator [Aeromicrobium sp. 636]|uniref:Response regulator transcription factor n=1 Tax=Aeromicrobium senzhongii TaxID=2663859 RepID=A0A8I0K390_9ACTN|nr:response regulator transcription factor [Aeromicrobium senzhongii]MBC9226990.1 response regulator transcription factor [Aeromicrobium senzhongii]MCQ3999090.1 response regulator [Aeromicrobium sp. 636]MTB89408.1 response regulator [Aeromicrobium senzhongii]QNL95795.1 response regulator transcription factor [Aeromicrobium senzhongii]
MIRVFLLDDHEVVRRGVGDLLEDSGTITVVGQAGTVAEAAEAIERLQPDVAVLDARLPDGSGIELCRRVRLSAENTAVLILTSYEDDEALFDAIMSGASGFLLKQVRGNDLVDAVQRVAAGQSLLDPAVTRSVLERLRHQAAPDPLADLTAQERKVFDQLRLGHSNREIAAHLFLSEKTVKNYVSTVLAKLGLERRGQVAAWKD